jgi:hypothetical protein
VYAKGKRWGKIVALEAATYLVKPDITLPSLEHSRLISTGVRKGVDDGLE